MRYGYLGVEVPPPFARAASGETVIPGALIRSVRPDDGPAAKANLQPGDVIVEFAGVPIENADQLVRVVGMTPVGALAEVRYVRGRTPHETVVTLAERPLPRQPFKAVADSGIGRMGWKGAELAEMSDATLRLYRLTRSEAGIMVTGASRGGKAEKAGLKPRDIILRCNGTRVRNLADFAKVLDQNPPRFKLDLLGGRTVRLPR